MPVRSQESKESSKALPNSKFVLSHEQMSSKTPEEGKKVAPDNASNSNIPLAVTRLGTESENPGVSNRQKKS